MATHQVRRLPVVEDGRLVGMLAQADVAMLAKEKKVGEALHEISKPRETAWPRWRKRARLLQSEVATVCDTPARGDVELWAAAAS